MTTDETIEDQVLARLQAAAREMFEDGQPWTLQTSVPVIVTMLAEAWEDSHEHCSSIGCINPYRSNS